MPETYVLPSFQVTLTAKEYRLVTMGLAQMLRDPQDIADATLLNEHLCHQRHHQLSQLAEVANKALEQARKISQSHEVFGITEKGKKQ